MIRKLTVTIGIPAYNEEANIGLLLRDLFGQKQTTFTLQRIIVSSDGSSDATLQVVRKVGAGRVTLIAGSTRRGVAVRQNQIIRRTTSDILVLLNADIRITDPAFVEKLISPVVNGKADLVSSTLVEAPPRTFLESVLVTGMRLKTILFRTWRNGQNGYLCRGAARAFGRRLYQKLNFKEGGGEDMYSYLMCLKQGYTFHWARNTSAVYRNPGTLKDHFKQSIRYFKFQAKFARDFDGKLVDRELKVPLAICVRGAIRALPIVIKSPGHVLGYLFLVCLTSTCVRLGICTDGDLWDVSTTKNV